MSSSIASSSSSEPCSIESMPARKAFLMPSVPIACAATRRPWRCASSIAAESSSGVNWAFPGTAPLVSTPPVAMSLMQSAPSHICSRTALRASQGESTARPIGQPWPPVMQSTAPEARIRGPGTRPSSIASRTSAAMWFELPTSRIVVTPALTDFRAFSTARRSRWFGVVALIIPIRSGSPLPSRCAWALTRPGVTLAPSRSHCPPAARSSATCPFSMTISTFCLGGSSVPS